MTNEEILNHFKNQGIDQANVPTPVSEQDQSASTIEEIFSKDDRHQPNHVLGKGEGVAMAPVFDAQSVLTEQEP